MSNLNDENQDTFTGVASGNQSGTVTVNTSDNGENVSAFFDNGSGGAPVDFTVVAERYSELRDRWMEYGRTTLTDATVPQSITDEAVPSKMRYSVVNDSTGSADFRINVVSY